MAYNEHLAERIRNIFQEKHVHNIEEKKMMGGLTFMVNEKMCIGIVKEELMVRLDPERHDEALTRTGCRTMDFTNKPMKGFVFISPEGFDAEADLDFWVQTALDYNAIAKASKKKKNN
jgi:TfoX/Sxy family transcriptional regulator of competence genes